MGKTKYGRKRQFKTDKGWRGHYRAQAMRGLGHDATGQAVPLDPDKGTSMQRDLYHGYRVGQA